jgi:hypothetical protein
LSSKKKEEALKQNDPIVRRVWEEGTSFSIQIGRQEARDEVLISGNRAGLITLARVFLFLAQHPEAGDRATVRDEVGLLVVRSETGKI